MEFSASVDGALGPHADEHHPLQPELAVLDLGDVLELGAQPGHPAEQVALLEVHRPGRGVDAGPGGLLGVGFVWPRFSQT